MTESYPFSAIVGQSDLKLALILNAVSPGIGGVLIRGEKGTAKSTAVRGLARLLPDIAVVAGCPFNCDPAQPYADCPAGVHPDIDPERRPVPLVELPVGAGADRVVGALDIEQALTHGRRVFEPGLLASAHRGILYVDEVNLLPDHLVDVLLDVTALGINYVERDGVSVKHPARYLLVGTMNPEEGELRPQLLDRFGISIHVEGTLDRTERAEVVRRRLAFDDDPSAFVQSWQREDEVTAARIASARAIVSEVTMSEEMLDRIAGICCAFRVDGLRGDIVTARTAAALAAWHGRSEVTAEDVDRAARLALPHRSRRDPLDPMSGNGLDDILRGPDDDGDDDPGSGPGGAGPPGATDTPATEEADDGIESSRERRLDPEPLFDPIRLEAAGHGAGAEGSRSKARGERGRSVSERPVEAISDVSVPATLRAAAPHQQARGRTGPGLSLSVSDLRGHLREGREGNLIVFVVDASASMGARDRMRAVKGAVLSLLRDAYRRRDRVAVVTFGGRGARVALPPTSSAELAARLLAEMPVGGRTPLAEGLEETRRILEMSAGRDPDTRPLVVLLTDGRANTGGSDPLASALSAAAQLARRNVRAVVVDTEHAPYRLSLASLIADAMGASSVRLEELQAGALTAIALGDRRRTA